MEDDLETVRQPTVDATAEIPGSAEVVWAFASDRHQPLADMHPVLALAQQLADHHGEQWSVEDRCRDQIADDQAVALAKRQIDALNMIRTGLVDQIDAWADARMVPEPAAALHTETLGQLTDRLAVAWVRSRRIAASAGQSRDRLNDARRALTLLAQLLDAYDDLLRDIRCGRRRLPAWRSLKLYGSAQ